MIALTGIATDEDTLSGIPYVTGIRRQGRLTVVIDTDPVALAENCDGESEIVFSFPVRTPWCPQEAVYIA